MPTESGINVPFHPPFVSFTSNVMFATLVPFAKKTCNTTELLFTALKLSVTFAVKFMSTPGSSESLFCGTNKRFKKSGGVKSTVKLRVSVLFVLFDASVQDTAQVRLPCERPDALKFAIEPFCTDELLPASVPFRLNEQFIAEETSSLALKLNESVEFVVFV